MVVKQNKATKESDTKMDVRELFNAYKMKRKRKITETDASDDVEREQPFYVSQHLTEKSMTTICPSLDKSVQVDDIVKETDEMIQLKINYHVKRLRLSTRQLLSVKK